MIGRIVVPLDGSDVAARAVGPARSLAEVTGATLVLMTARGDDDVLDARRHLDEQAAAARYEATDTVIVHDRAATAAIVLETGHPETVVCMATHGRGGLTHAVLGSVAEEVLRQAKHPLLLVGPAVERGIWQFAHWFEDGNLLVPLDGSACAEQIMAAAREWAGLLDLRIWAVQVLEPRAATAARGEAPESAYVHDAVKTLGEDGATAQWEVLHSPEPAPAIVDYAQRLPATLIAMTTHGRSGFARLTLGSVAMHVVHDAPCPVLVMRPGLLRS